MPKKVEIRDEKIDAKLNQIIGRLNALQASIDDIETFLSGYRPKRRDAIGDKDA